MNNEQEQEQGEQPTPEQDWTYCLERTPDDGVQVSVVFSDGTESDCVWEGWNWNGDIVPVKWRPIAVEQPKKKYYLTAEQQRICDVLGEYERAYISVSSKQGNFLVLNGDITEHVRSNTLTALVKKGYLGENGRNRLKLI